MIAKSRSPDGAEAASDKYVPVDWDEAFREIGQELNALSSILENLSRE
jgi:anaerobic selenocysteine-containing dehydrogenase